MSRFSARCAVIGVTSLFTFSGCSRQTAAPPPPPPPPVTVATPIVSEVVDYEEVDGRAVPVEVVEVRARVSGYLDKVKFQNLDKSAAKPFAPGVLKEGDKVDKDVVLFEIDPRPYAAVLAAAKAEVERTKALVGRLTADVKRAETLRASNNISQEEFDKTNSTLAEAVATQKLAEAQQQTADLNFEFTKVKAPIAGRLGYALVTAGNLVNADVTPLTTIVREDPIHVDFDVSDQVVLRYQELIRKGELTSAREGSVPVWIALANDVGFPMRGEIDFVDNQFNKATGTMRIRARFDNPEGRGGIRRLTAGINVPRVRVPSSKPYPAVLISERAMTVDLGSRIVYVVDSQNIAHRREIVLGTAHEGLVAIKEGLKADERIVVNGIQRVRDGKPVQPETGKMPGADQFLAAQAATKATMTEPQSPVAPVPTATPTGTAMPTATPTAAPSPTATK